MSEDILLHVADTVLTLVSLVVGFILGLQLRKKEDEKVDKIVASGRDGK